MKQTDIHFLSYLAQFILEWEMFQTKVLEKITTHTCILLTKKSFSQKHNTVVFNNVNSLWAENGQTLPKHVVIIKLINYVP